MNLLVISDLHIDNGHSLGTFRWDCETFIRVLEHVRRIYRIDRLVLNGDIFELFKYRYDDIKAKKPELIDYLMDEDTIYIRGNHDNDCPYGHDHVILENKEGRSIYIEHGHRGDFFNGTLFGRVVSNIFFKFLNKLSISRALRTLYFRIVENSDTYNMRTFNTFRYMKYALRLLKVYDIVIFGHTHKLEAHKLYYHNEKKRYLNCGSCQMGRFQGLIFNTESLRYETVKIEKDEIESFLQYERHEKQELVS